MTAEKFKRKLTAILSADVKGYSCLMGADGEVTVHTLQAYFSGWVGFLFWPECLLKKETTVKGWRET